MLCAAADGQGLRPWFHDARVELMIGKVQSSVTEALLTRRGWVADERDEVAMLESQRTVRTHRPPGGERQLRRGGRGR